MVYSMRFPDWVPEQVRSYTKSLLTGDPGMPGLIEERDRARRQDNLELAKHYEAEIQCIYRLTGIDDDRIKEACSILTESGSQPETIQGFVASAWAARMDYSKHRERLWEAKKLAERISMKAYDLVALLEQASRYYDQWPGEMFSVSTLLRSTDGNDPLWPGLRKRVLGDDSTDPDFGLRYIWGRTAPSVSDCLAVLAEAAGKCEPVEFNLVGAAINRQENPKLEYVRAFGAVLLERHILLSSAVIKAMAVAATVVLDDPDIDIAAKDVRQALKVGGITGERQNPAS
jgi:hypothetical protein